MDDVVWETVGDVELRMLPDLLGKAPYTCSCKHCLIKRRTKSGNTCFAYWVAVKRYAEKKLIEKTRK